jgi:HK97 family phage major capsid protein
MSKKFIIDGVEYIAKDSEEAAKVEETGAETAAEETADLETKIDEAAEKMVAKLGLDELHKKFDELRNAVAPEKKESKISALMDLEKLMKKDVGQMTAREKIIGFFQGIMQNNHAVMKALSEGSAADGGYLFPDEFRSEIIRDILETPHMRNEVTVVPMRRDILKVPTLASGPSVTWTEENAAKTTTSAHFGEVTLTVKKMAAILYASDELIADSQDIDVVNFIISLFAERIGAEEDRVITRGNGTTEPTGYSGSGASMSSANGNLSFDDMINLEYLLPAKYTPNAKFYVHRNNVRELRKLKDSQGRYLWSDPVSAGQPATFHGYPVVEDNNLPESTIVFGDLKKAYWLGDRQQMTVKVSQDTETAFTKDQTAIRVVARIAGNVVLPAAIKRLTGIA